jgi:putative FmdB family regulatory protein
MRKEGAMPTYEYQCQSCGHEFAIVQSLSEHGKAPVHCPQCRNEQVKQLVSLFIAQTSKKS